MVKPGAVGRIGGIVRDSETRAPIFDAVVSVHYAAAGESVLITDSAGEFSAALEAPDPQWFEVEKEGYAPVRAALSSEGAVAEILLARRAESDCASGCIPPPPVIDIGSSTQIWTVHPDEWTRQFP
jgi:hypothetical protein